jgi:hypothetical protein
MGSVAARVVVLSAVAMDVMLVVHSVGVLLSVVLGLEPFDLIHALGLGELVNLRTSEGCNDLLSEGVTDGLAYFLFEKSLSDDLI